MQQPKSRTPWIVCGVIALVVVCGGAFILIGGVSLLAIFNRDSREQVAGMATQTTAPVVATVVQNEQAQIDTPTPVGPASTGQIAGIPYRTVVQIIAMINIDGGTGSGLDRIGIDRVTGRVDPHQRTCGALGPLLPG